MAEIRLPTNKKKDTHNLGKTTLGQLLNFCLLASRNSNFFLFKHFDLFKNFIFFLEIELWDGSFVTIRRGIEESSKISFKIHKSSKQDFSLLPDRNWDHFAVPFDRAKSLLDGLLDLRAIKPWSFRNGLGYLLRSQDDFGDVFQLNKFKSAHSDWKPYLAHILGFDAKLVEEYYQKEEELVAKKGKESIIEGDLGGSIEDISKIEGMLLLKSDEVEKKQRLLDNFDFRLQDKQKTKNLVDEIDEHIGRLNKERYSLAYRKKKIIDSLEDDQILFDPDAAENLFREAGVFFSGQIKRDFQQLITFNKAITEERRGYLLEERSEIEAALKKINNELNDLGKRRAATLSFLSGTDIFSKYKSVSNELISIKADIASLERQRGFLHRLQELRKDIRNLTDEKKNIQIQIEDDVEKQNAETKSFFSSIRLFFNEIVEEVIARKALLKVSVNSEGHLEFKPDILDEAGNTSSADMGHTYKKLLCIAFDLAVLRAHLHEKYPRFVYHDGVFESLDDRKKENLLNVLRKYAELGIQQIITLIHSDLPTRTSKDGPVFNEHEIVLHLHDEGEKGRLFKMKAW
jgi:uncharacterized protein YydD (DUF2326 family)